MTITPDTPFRGSGRLRVLHVMTRMSTAGTERQLVGMLQAAHGRFWDAHLCVLYEGFPLAEEAAAFMPVTQLGYTSSLDPRRPVALRRLAASIGADVVHPSLWGASFLTRMSLIGSRRPTIVMSERRVEDFRPPWTRRLDAALRAVTDGWIGNSDDVVDFIRRAHGAPPDRISCIRNGIDPEVFHHPSGPRSAGGPRIGAVGRLVPEKSFDIAIAAMPMILKAFPNASLSIAGEGPEKNALLSQARALPVDLIGLLSTPGAVADFMRTLDVFVLPSRFEGLPNVVLEAQACGVPVVVTDVPGMSQAVGPGARVVPAGDPAALSEAILGALRGSVGGESPPARSFDDVAQEHLQAFESARARQRVTR